MIKFRTIPFILGVSTTFLALFFFFGIFLHYAEVQKREKIAEVRKQEHKAQKRLNEIYAEKQRQRRRADSLEVLLEAYQNPKVLWTARAAYSETRRPHEMWYVSWVIRNRVEANFRGKESYKSVILDDKQFSAFNKGYPLRDFYMSLEPKHVSENERWFQAIKTASEVVNGPESHRPFFSDTYHFYSEVSMPNGNRPDWVPYVIRVQTPMMKKLLVSKRFKFYRKTKFATNSSSVAR